MAEQLLTHRNLTTTPRHRSKLVLGSSEVDGVEMPVDVKDDYRHFLLERRVPPTESSNRVLVNWLTERKEPSVEA